MFGENVQFEVQGGGGQAPVPQEPSEEFRWLKGTRWNWNNWREVEFDPSGRFKAPTQDCEQGQCRWASDDSHVYVQWGQAGLHKLAVKGGEAQAEKGTVLEGVRMQDDDPVSATFVAKTKEQEEAEEAENLYEILGVSEDATDKDIKRAYRKLSLKYHPDKNTGDAAAQRKFNLVRDAYEVLSNPDKKILFDTGGMDAVKEHDKEKAQGGAQAMDPFSAMFGGGGGGGGRGTKKDQDFQAELSTSLADLYKGNEISTSISRRVVCRGCRGKKGRKKPQCKECGRCPNEVKMVQRQVGPGFTVQQQQEVRSKERCKEQSVTLKAVIEKGMGDGSKITFPRMSEQRPGQIPGDVIMVIKQKQHDTFKRRGNDLKMEMEITLREAPLGFKKVFKHLDDHEFTVSRSGVTKPFQTIRLRGEGMPLHGTPSEHGDLLVRVTVRMPRKLSKEQMDLVASAL
eukprot:g2514.t1